MAGYADIVIPFINTQTIFVIVLLLALSFYILKQQKQNLPPGPRSLPLIGSLPSLAFSLYRTGCEPETLFGIMAKQYGDDVISFSVGKKVIVILNGCKVIKEAYQNPHMNDRPTSPVLEELDLDQGVVFASGKSWKYQRALTMSAFRNFGVGRSKFEGNITEEAKTLIHAMRQYNEKPFHPFILIGNCVANVICSVIFGQRYEHSDPDFKHLLHITSENANKIGSGAFVLFVRILRYIFHGLYKAILTNFLSFKTFVNGIVAEHRHKFHKNNINDLMDVFLNEIEKSTENTLADDSGCTPPDTNNRADFIHEKSLMATAVGLFLAGTETSATVLRWALLYMMTYPEIQAKVQQELDLVVGRSRMPKWADRLILPYTEAVLLAIQRIRRVVPLGVPHVAAKDTKIGDYDVPKGSIIVSNLWAVHNDPNIWTEPDQFRPERFLDEDGKLRHREEFIPFSAGHRVCLGENLAKMEIFIFFTYIFHTFTIKNPYNKPYSLKGVSGVTFSPTDFEIVAEIRD
ncbi:cytochrome P450 2J4-like [Amphiura filiformis]|uniref:cytochrome P450 2J4-like n=1 Tax=Amphiura filiformis TaxID=82378 RepID=UPI003B225ED8